MAGDWAGARNPVWLLVNTSIQAEVAEVVATNSAMLDILQLMRQEVCSVGPMSSNFNTEDSCRYYSRLQFIFQLHILSTAEFETLKAVAAEVDRLQSLLFHDGSDQTRLATVLGLIELTKVLDTRLQQLFRAGYRCPEEIHFIKFNLM